MVLNKDPISLAPFCVKVEEIWQTAFYNTGEQMQGGKKIASI